MDVSDVANQHRFDTFIRVIRTEFRPLFDRLDAEDISTVLLLQIKGSDVHPSQRAPDFFYHREHPLKSKLRNLFLVSTT